MTINALSDRVTVVLGILDEAEAAQRAGEFDMVLVNIIAHIIGGMALQLAQVLKPGGILIASGIIEARRPDAEQPLLDAGLELVEQAMTDDWIVLMMRKRA